MFCKYRNSVEYFSQRDYRTLNDAFDYQGIDPSFRIAVDPDVWLPA
jgi:hypothetical protein